MLGPHGVSAPGSRQVFIGRAEEIARLRAGFEDAQTGRGRLILLSGPPGIGKSRLSAEFADLVAGEGARVLVGRSWESGGAPAYWPWVQAIRAYLRAADRDLAVGQMGSGANEIATLLPEVAELVPAASHSVSVDPTADRFRLFDATATFLRKIAENEPLVVILDDLQAADVPSLLLLQFVTDQLAESRILIVATYRDVEVSPDHPLSTTLAALHRAPVTIALTIPGLDAEEVTRFVEATSGSGTQASISVMLHRQTSGNPLFLGEAVRLLTTTPAGEIAISSVHRLSVPAEIRAVIERRLEGLTAAGRMSLRLASVLGNEFELETIRRLVDSSTDEILEHVGEAVAAGLLAEVAGVPGRFRFQHDLFRDTLYAGLAPAQRITFHRQAAEVLEGFYGDDIENHLAELALHHFEAAPGGRAGSAVEFARRAGDQALRSLAYEEAGRLYQMAIQVMENVERSERPVMVDLLLQLGDARVRAGDLPAAGRTFLRAAEIARSLGDASRLARAAVEYGGRFIWARAGGDTRMVPLLQDALVMLGGEDDGLRVRLLSRLACASRSSADREHGAALSRQALDLAREMNDPHTLIYALTGRAGAIWWPENPEERLAIGKELVAIGETAGVIEGVIDGHMAQCAALVELGDIRAAHRELEILSRTGGPLRLPAQHWLEGAMRAWFALLEGSLAEVEPWIDEMLGQGPTTPARDNASAALFQLFLLRREQGRLDEIAEAVRAAADDFPWYPLHRIALAYLLASIGRETEARQILEDLSADRFAGLHRDNYWVMSLCLASEVAVLLGDRQNAAILYELLEPYSARNAVAFAEGSLGSVSRYLGLLTAARGDSVAAEKHLSFAEAFNRRMGARPWVAHTLYDTAQLLTVRDDPGDNSRAAVLLGECLELCSEMGLVALQPKIEASSQGSVPLPEPARSHPEASARFRRDGEYFSVEFAGVGFRIKDTKGLQYLAVLLGSPGREIHALDLIAAVGGVDPASRGRSNVSSQDVTAGDDAGPTLDRQARKAYERRIVELEEDVTEADAFGDAERASMARQERDFLVSELAAAVGLGGRDRAAVSVSERARVNVTRSIRSALVRIARHSPVLGDHLEATIHTGTFCSYTPDPRTPVKWNS